jgi:hypothetical protein
MCQISLDAFAPASPDSLPILLLDNSGAHMVQRPHWPENVRGVGLPPDCPELNRIQRVWRGLRDEMAWQQFVDLAAHLDAVSHLPQACDAPAPQALTGYTHLAEVIHALYA